MEKQEKILLKLQQHYYQLRIQQGQRVAPCLYEQSITAKIVHSVLQIFKALRKLGNRAMVEIIYISRLCKQSKRFIENLLAELKEKGIKDIKYIPQNIMIETDKFRVYGLPIDSGCLRLSHGKVKYYINEVFKGNRKVTENEHERYIHLLQTFPQKTREIEREELIKILVSGNLGQKMCEFCEEVAEINYTDTSPQICTDGKKYFVYFHGLDEEYYKINYCPVCGRKLSEVSENE